MGATVLHAAIALAISLWVVWLALLIVLTLNRPDSVAAKEALRLVPDCLRLLRRLTTDRAVPKGARVRVWLLIGYLACPIDLVPDFLPVIGYADDVILVAVTLRAVVRRAGVVTLERHWPGTPDGLRTLLRVAGMDNP